MMTNLLFSQASALGKRLAMVLTMLLIVGIGKAWGENIELTTSTLGLSGTAYAESSKTVSGVTISYKDISVTNGIQMKASTGCLWNTSAMPQNIDSIVLSGITFSGASPSGVTVCGSTSAKGSTTAILNAYKTTGKIKVDFTNYSYKYFYIKNAGSSRTVRIESIKIYYSSSTPTITVTPETISFGTINIGESTNKTFVVKGSNLTGNITLSGNLAPVTFTPTTITKAEAESANGKTITVTFSPTTTTNISETITLTSSDAESKTVKVTGIGQQVYSVHYYVNGTEITALKESVVAGGKVASLPDGDVVSSCDDANYPYFIGWSTSNFGKSTIEPTTLVSGTEAINAETHYHAVFAKGTGGGTTTITYDFESTATTPWQNSYTLTSSQGVNNSKAGSITGNGQVTYNAKVPVISFSFSIKRASNNTNGTVYIERSTDGQSWTQCASYGINNFSNGSYTTQTYNSFDGNEYYVRVRYQSTGTAQRYIDNVSITYGGDRKSVV